MVGATHCEVVVVGATHCVVVVVGATHDEVVVVGATHLEVDEDEGAGKRAVKSASGGLRRSRGGKRNSPSQVEDGLSCDEAAAAEVEGAAADDEGAVQDEDEDEETATDGDDESEPVRASLAAAVSEALAKRQLTYSARDAKRQQEPRKGKRRERDAPRVEFLRAAKVPSETESVLFWVEASATRAVTVWLVPGFETTTKSPQYGETESSFESDERQEGQPPRSEREDAQLKRLTELERETDDDVAVLVVPSAGAGVAVHLVTLDLLVGLGRVRGRERGLNSRETDGGRLDGSEGGEGGEESSRGDHGEQRKSRWERQRPKTGVGRERLGEGKGREERGEQAEAKKAPCLCPNRWNACRPATPRAEVDWGWLTKRGRPTREGPRMCNFFALACACQITSIANGKKLAGPWGSPPIISHATCKRNLLPVRSSKCG